MDQGRSSNKSQGSRLKGVPSKNGNLQNVEKKPAIKRLPNPLKITSQSTRSNPIEKKSVFNEGKDRISFGDSLNSSSGDEKMNEMVAEIDNLTRKLVKNSSNKSLQEQRSFQNDNNGFSRQINLTIIRELLSLVEINWNHKGEETRTSKPHFVLCWKLLKRFRRSL
eukprot:TRINITY_DN9137_c0_g1_i1.p1 TRINITY_DN9137_c0_g1~~TRINITY_DN9137_c0_g1_i1.p1  ORF type:complete len:166 (-),score=42.02 TRINITY_DN9137_c0_g1_i1:115-612(-)